MSRVGLVAIGRNEGERLHQCLKSVVGKVDPIVYVDSGSTDDSVAMARSLGVVVVELDLSIPFTAARARNAGFQYLQEHYSEVEYVQFVDGDCEVIDGWIAAATKALDAQPQVVAVCGWRQERYPDRSVFNRICDMEWHMGPVGEILCFGGDVMMRTKALAAIGGYDDAVIAAEDDEVGVRLRQAGGKLLRIDQNSTIHDADIHSLSQWWKRAKRAGYAYSLVRSMHGAPPERKFVKEVRRIWLWGLMVPLGALVLAVPTKGLSLLILVRYPLAAARAAYGTHKRGFSWADSIAWGLSCGASVFPEAMGALQFQLVRLRHQPHKIIEYKGAQTPTIDAIQPTGR